ncbi:hypothetical protein DYB36_001900 [Aphanomyces astaci]|uniref:histone acetyltransferase n=1 Tax=Aphanomyces astaci TaxID=112090 RepID=A0A397AEZ6_APHAT|nr:hypothetical protein DYB36_001900 [Aphanomyces astaci]
MSYFDCVHGHRHYPFGLFVIYRSFICSTLTGLGHGYLTTLQSRYSIPHTFQLPMADAMNISVDTGSDALPTVTAVYDDLATTVAQECVKLKHLARVAPELLFDKTRGMVLRFFSTDSAEEIVLSPVDLRARLMLCGIDFGPDYDPRGYSTDCCAAKAPSHLLVSLPRKPRYQCANPSSPPELDHLDTAMLLRRRATESCPQPSSNVSLKRKGLADLCGEPRQLESAITRSATTKSAFSAFKRTKCISSDDTSKKVVADSPRAKWRLLDTETKMQMQRVPVIEFGRFEIETWYPSPYPTHMYPDNKLFVCENCLGYTSTKRLLEHHRSDDCPLAKQRPPGRTVYEEALPDAPSPSSSSLILVEVDGMASSTYCQNLCLLAKLFMDQKTLYFDVSVFWFYLLCIYDKRSGNVHPVGYFSKEKANPDQYNLSCIVVFPPYQRRGYGSLLISLSYELTKREHTVGTPEKPLSVLGRAAYMEYWRFVLLTELCKMGGSSSSTTTSSTTVSIQKLSAATAITPDDIVATLRECPGVVVSDKSTRGSPTTVRSTTLKR